MLGFLAKFAKQCTCKTSYVCPVCGDSADQGGGPWMWHVISIGSTTIPSGHICSYCAAYLVGIVEGAFRTRTNVEAAMVRESVDLLSDLVPEHGCSLDACKCRLTGRLVTRFEKPQQKKLKAKKNARRGASKKGNAPGRHARASSAKRKKS